MAASPFSTVQNTPAEFGESAGAVLFHLSTRRVCLLHLKSKDEWLLAKGRRNCTESRSGAALREVREETGYSCRLLDVSMHTPAPSANEVDVSTPDEPGEYCGHQEPFMLTTRKLGERNLKLIWWFVAAVNGDEGHAEVVGETEAKYGRELVGYDDALQKLTFLEDCEVVARAIGIVQGTEKAKRCREEVTASKKD